MVAPVVAAAGIATVGSLLGGKGAKKAAKKAAQAQAQAAQAGIAEQRRQFDVTQGNLQPFLAAGQEALGAQGALLGLKGAEPQGQAIEQLKNSPLFRSLFSTGEEAILANASATGGLRGGNVQRSLADFGSDTLAKVIQQQLQNLGGISANGSQTGTNLGSLGSQNSNAISNLMQQQGAATAGGIVGRAAINSNMMNNVFSSLGMFLGQGGLRGGLGASPGISQSILGASAPATPGFSWTSTPSGLF